MSSQNPIEEPEKYATHRDIKDLKALVHKYMEEVASERKLNDYRVRKFEQKMDNLTSIVQNWAHISERLREDSETLRSDVQEIMNYWLPTKNAGIAARVLLKGLKWLVGLAVMLSALYAAWRGGGGS